MNLREKIIQEMNRHEEKQKQQWGERFHRQAFASYCTWWFRHAFECKTADAHKELVAMEKEGLVTADRSQRNNTKWLLVAA